MHCFANYTLDIMQNAIILHNKHWENTPFDVKINRDLLKKLLKFHHNKEIQIITGIRRSGKSSLLKLYINDLIKTENTKSILFINFDDPSFFEVYQNPEKIHNIIEEAERLTQTKIKYLFLDEIQIVETSQKFTPEIYANKIYKIITKTQNSCPFS